MGYLDRPAIVDPLDVLSLALRLSPRPGLAVASYLGGDPCLRLALASSLRDSPRFLLPVTGPLRLIPGRHGVPPEPGQAPPEARQEDHGRRQGIGGRQGR